MHCHTLADTVGSVSETTVNLHSTVADVVICLTSLNHLCRDMQKYFLSLNQRRTPSLHPKPIFFSLMRIICF